MARKCDICGKTPQTGYHVSHSHVRTKRRWHPNLQQTKTVVKGRKVTLRVCAKCLKAGKMAPAS